jgi:hypothetical protein
MLIPPFMRFTRLVGEHVRLIVSLAQTLGQVVGVTVGVAEGSGVIVWVAVGS